MLVMLSSKKSTVQRSSLVLADLCPGPGLILEKYKRETAEEVHIIKMFGFWWRTNARFRLTPQKSWDFGFFFVLAALKSMFFLPSGCIVILISYLGGYRGL